MGAGLPPVLGAGFGTTVARDLRRMVFGQDIMQAACTTNGVCPGSGTSLSDGVETVATHRGSYLSPLNNAINDIQALFVNWYTTFDDLGEHDAPNAITIKAVLEYPLNTFYTITWNQGQTTNLVMPAGGQYLCDPIPIQIPKNTRFYIRTVITVTSGQKYPTMKGALTGLGQSYLTGVDSLTTASIANTFGYIYEPIAIYAKMNQHLPNIAYMGDSITYGLGDTNDATGNIGWGPRAVLNTYPGTKFCKSSESVNQFINSINSRSRRRLAAMRLAPYTHATCLWGTNDLTASRTSTQVIADLTAAYQFLADMGIQCIAVTVPPHTSSSGGQWINAADQTPTNGIFNTTHRAAINAFLLAGPANTVGTYDLDAVVRDPSSVNVWLTNNSTNKLYTNDGLHPNPAGNILIANDFAPRFPTWIY